FALLKHCLGVLAFSDINVCTHKTLRAAVWVIRYRTPRLDPSALPIGTDDAIFVIVLPIPVGDRSSEVILDARQVIWVNSRSPISARGLERSLWQAVDGSISR